MKELISGRAKEPQGSGFRGSNADVDCSGVRPVELVPDCCVDKPSELIKHPVDQRSNVIFSVVL